MGNLKAKLTLVNSLHVLRAEQKLTQQELADAIGVTRATINALEKGNYNPSLELAFSWGKSVFYRFYDLGKFNN
jgi:putative transcriptional regulator